MGKVKEKIIFGNLSNYQKGIFWSLGSWSEVENAINFRCKYRYFLEQLQDITDSNIFNQKDDKKHQYVLKTYILDIDSFKMNSWTERNAEIRNIPYLEDYKDFLRAYIELHSGLDYSLRYGRGKKYKWKSLRLRIYGNYILLESINNILHEKIGTTKKILQKTGNQTTKVLNYTSLKEIEKIYRYLEGNPNHKEYWEDVYQKLNTPKIYL